MLWHGTRDDTDTRRASCLYGSLVTHGTNQLACGIGPLSCSRGEQYVKAVVDAGALAGSCAPSPSCGAGEVYDEALGACTRVVRESGNTLVVDVGSWARLVLGTDGAEGTNAFCAPVRATGAVGRFQIELSFRDNDVTQASIRITSRPGTLPNASDAAEQAAQQLTQALRFLGGTASAAAVSLDVGCTPPMAATPTLEEPKKDVDGGR